MNYSLLLDLAAVIILIVSCAVMAKKGIIKSLFKISSIVLTIVAVLLLSEPAENLMAASGLGLKIDEIVYSSIISDDKSDEQITEEEENVNSLPEFLTNAVGDAAENALAPAVSNVVKKLICALALYFIIKLVLYLVFLLIEGLFKMPVLRSVNGLLGAAVGIVSGLIIIYLICGIASLNVTNSAVIREVVDSTYIVKYFYDGNVLMNLFLLTN